MRHLRAGLINSRGSDAPDWRKRRRRLRLHRRGHAIALSVSRLEDRVLLSGGDPGSVAVPLVLDVPIARVLAPGGADVYRITLATGGRLTVELAAPGVPARLSLLDSQGTPLVQSDGLPSSSGPGWLDVNVPAGTSFLEVETAGSGGNYEVAAHLTPAAAPFSTIPAQFQSASNAPMTVADFNGDGMADLATPDGIRLGIGDGTFASDFLATGLTSPDHTISAMTSGDFNGDGRRDLAVLEFANDGSGTDLKILRNLGGGTFAAVSTFAVDQYAGTVQTINYGAGVVGLAVANWLTGQVTVFDADGGGGFTPGAILDGGAHPTSVVSGRFAGRRLLIVADQGDPITGEGGGLKVYQSNGAGLFLRLADLDAQLGPSALAAGDFNGDGLLDLAVANTISNSVSILLGQSDATFGSAASFTVGSLPQALTTGDFNGDGRLDLAVANANSGDVSLLLGNGDGSFQPQLRAGADSFPSAIAATDLNSDGRLDLVVGNKGSNNVSLLLGKGDGTFQDGLVNPVGSGPNGAVSVDLDRDGHLDLVTVDTNSDGISVLLGKGDGIFQRAASFAAGVRPNALVTGDFNGDGRLDLAVADLGDLMSGAGMGVSILLGNGDGTFRSPVLYLKDSAPVAITSGDFTGDGKLDVAILDQYTNTLQILAGTGTGSFTALAPIALNSDPSNPSSPVLMTSGDFTGDGVADLAVVSIGFSWTDFTFTGSVAVVSKSGGNDFQVLPSSPLDSCGFPEAIVAADFTGDGKLDLAISTGDLPGAVVVAGDGLGGFTPLASLLLNSGGDPRALVATDLTGDGKLDIAIADPSSNIVSVFQNEGNGTFQSEVGLAPGSVGRVSVLATGDFNGDGRIDLATVRQGPNSVSVELNQGNATFVDAGSVGLSPHNTPLVADLDGDGILDIAVVDGSGNILFRKGQPGQPGRYDPPITINAGLPSRDIAAVDTSQGILLASVNATDGYVSLFGNRGGQFILLRSLPVGETPAQVLSADLLGRGSARDLIVRNAGDGTITIELGDDRGDFSRRTDIQVGAGISDVALADVNGDGLPDLLLTNQITGQVEVLISRGGGQFDLPTLYRAGAGLLGVNETPGAASASVVSREGTVGVVTAALTRGGPVDLVTVNPGSATLGILSGLGSGRFSNPDALPTNGEASIVRSADVNGDGVTDLAVIGSSGLTLWRGDGAGRLIEGTSYDVGANPTGLTITDVDGDAKLDLVVGDANGDILLLLGDGQGSFRLPFTADQGVSLMAMDVQGRSAKTFIFSDQSRNRVVVRNSASLSQSTVLGDRTSGLLLPGAPALADLNGDGIPDLIVANTGGNSVLVYPGLADGTFGPALNNGQGYAVGTNPSAVIAADVNGDGRLDLLVANKGSNDISVLINQTQPRTSTFAFAQGLRLQAGSGPTSLAYADINNDGIGDLVVSDSSSRDVRVLSGIGNGFFNDASPKIVPISQDPGGIYVGNFGGGSGPDLVTLNPGTRGLTMISGLATGSPTTRVFSSGGINPIDALFVPGSNGFDSLVVANNADGHVALLSGGPLGLSVEQVAFSTGAPNPTSLAFGSLRGNSLEVYAATEGQESATLLIFTLPTGGTNFSTTAGSALTLLPAQDSSIPLIATLLTTVLSTSTGLEETETTEDQGGLAAISGSAAGQSLSAEAADNEQGDDEVIEETSEDESVPSDDLASVSVPPWLRVVIGIDEAFAEFRLEDPPSETPETAPKGEQGSLNAPATAPSPVTVPGSPTSQVTPLDDPDDAPPKPDRTEIIDTAVGALMNDLRELRGLGPELEIILGSVPDAIVSSRADSGSTLGDTIAKALVLGGLLLHAGCSTYFLRSPSGTSIRKRWAGTRSESPTSDRVKAADSATR